MNHEQWLQNIALIMTSAVKQETKNKSHALML